MDAFLQTLGPAKRFRHCGQYHAALELLNAIDTTSLPPTQAVLVSFEQASVHMAQGYLARAAEVMRLFNTNRHGAAEEQLVRVSTALLDVLVQGRVRAARTIAEDTSRAIPRIAELARPIEVTCIRISLLATMVQDVPATQAEDMRRHARVRLAAMMDDLLASGRLDDAFDVLILLLQVPAPSDALPLLDAFLAQCDPEGGCEHLRAPCLLERAEKLHAAELPWMDALAEAKTLFLKCGNVVGNLDARVFETAHGQQQPEATLRQLVELTNEYEPLDYPRGQLSALNHICGIAALNGQYNLYFAAAEDQRELAERLALQLQVVFYLLRHIWALTAFDGHFGKVVECFDWVIAFVDGAQLDGLKALFLQAYGFAHTIRGNRGEAIPLSEKAYDLLLMYGPPDQISRQALFLGQAYLQVDELPLDDRDRAYETAKTKFLQFVQWDVDHGIVEGLETKYLSLVILCVLRGVSPKTLDEAKHWLAEASALQSRMTPAYATSQRVASALLEAQALISICERDPASSLAAYERAMHTTFTPQMHLQLLFVLIKSALADFAMYQQCTSLQSLDSAEEKLLRADAYLAQLFVFEHLNLRASVRYRLATIEEERLLRGASAANLYSAVDRLATAWRFQESLRRELSVLPRAIALRHKVRLSADRLTRDTLDLAIRLASLSGDASLMWSWLQRAKARSLSDMVGLNMSIPANVVAGLDVDGQALLLDLRDLAQRASEAPTPAKPELRRQFALLHERMSQHLVWRQFMNVRDGDVAVGAMLSLGPDDADCLVVDYLIVSSDKIVVLTGLPGEPPRAWPVSLTAADVRRWKDEFLNITDLEYNGRCLRRLAPLVAHLSQCSAPGQLLIFVPHGPLHGIPLHAIPLGGAPLLQRNPVVYTPSTAVMRQCRTRSVHLKNPNSLFFGPAQDRPGALLSASHLADQLGGRAILGDEATLTTFREASSTAGLVHFHGHAQFEISDPQQSHLKLADGVLTAQNVLELPFSPCDISLIACGSGQQYIAPGDEPSGLIPALLVAGATSIVATLWPVRDDDGLAFSSVFYHSFVGAEVVDLARSAQKAALHIRAAKATSAPFFWASFVLYGSWTRSQTLLPMQS
ncbi:hypothetical protein AURDEDRAFT_151154 [Auricularia subglabra TFB-10046 SS5]|nr:hypothetical protein AURDEDRAFT_151154 [Auricularia subglabra TFB-10046 SS5]